MKFSSKIGRDMQAMRKNRRGGAPRKEGVPRCPCSANTWKRAEALCFRCCKAAGLMTSGVKAAEDLQNTINSHFTAQAEVIERRPHTPVDQDLVCSHCEKAATFTPIPGTKYKRCDLCSGANAV